MRAAASKSSGSMSAEISFFVTDVCPCSLLESSNEAIQFAADFLETVHRG